MATGALAEVCSAGAIGICVTVVSHFPDSDCINNKQTSAAMTFSHWALFSMSSVWPLIQDDFRQIRIYHAEPLSAKPASRVGLPNWNRPNYLALRV